jgi:hypothetical protein
LKAQDQLGPIKVDLDLKNESDFSIFIHTEPEPTQDRFLWQFKNTATFILHPKRVQQATQSQQNDRLAK